MTQGACSSHPSHRHPRKLAYLVVPGDVVSDDEHLYWSVTRAQPTLDGLIDLELAGAEDGVNADRETHVRYGRREFVTLAAEPDPSVDDWKP